MKKLLILTIILVQACGQGPVEVAQFRGPERNGIYPESGLLNSWPEEGPRLLWNFEGLGRGYAAPAVGGDMVYVNGEEEGGSFLFALDTAGALHWKVPNGNEFLGEGFSSTYPGSRSTPTLYGDLVYTASGRGRIACFEKESGNERWSHHIIDDAGGILGYFGYSESLAVDEKWVYCFPGGSKNNVLALDRLDGEIVWASPALRDTFAYGSLVPLDLPEAKILLATSRHYLFTLDRETGDLLASYKLEGYEYDGEHCNTPVYLDGFVYFVANDIPGQGSMKLSLSDDGRTIREIWRNPEVRNNFGGFILAEQGLYTMVRGNKLLELSLDDGQISDSLRISTGSIIGADNKLICYGHNGDVNLVPLGGEGLQSAGTFKVRSGSGHHFSHPVVSDGVLYIRHGNDLAAYAI